MNYSETTVIAFCQELEKIALQVNPALAGGAAALTGAAGAGAAMGGEDRRLRGAGAGLVGGAAGAAAGAAGGQALGGAIGKHVGKGVGEAAKSQVPLLGKLFYGKKVNMAAKALKGTHGAVGRMAGGAAGALGLGLAGAMAGGAAARKKKRGIKLTIDND